MRAFELEKKLKRTLHAALAAIAILGVAAASYALKAKTLLADRDGRPDYSAIIPESFGDWKLVPSIRLVTPVDDDALANRVYSQMIGRGYADKAGNVVMLLVAYGPRQIDRLQLHRPEVCYVAEGFRVSGSTPVTIDLNGRLALPARKLVAQREGRIERITYWMRIGDDVVSTLFSRQWTKLRYGLRGLIADGVLVRISTINMDAATAERVHAQFLEALMKAVPGPELKHFVGSRAVRAGFASDGRRASRGI
jgi:EpsI family protein